MRAANPDIQVEVHIVASSGATTSDVFEGQRRDPLETIPGNKKQDPADIATWHDENDLAVNTRQVDQIPMDADAVIIGLGGNDVFFGPLVEALAYGDVAKARALIDKTKGLLNTDQPDQTYRDQADNPPPGQEPGHAETLIARLLQVQQASRPRRSRRCRRARMPAPVGAGSNPNRRRRHRFPRR